jgi:hypothetical protein
VFGVLVAIKCALLVQFGRHIFEYHWRVQSEVGTSMLGTGAFIAFVLLGSLSLFRLAADCRDAHSIRMANLVIFSLGLAFIFLTFHSGENPFLYPILLGVLKWSSLGPYLSMKLFFERPYLGAWLLAYVAGYYVLARTGREKHVLRMTAVFGGTYALLNLQELAAMEDALVLLDCVVLASVLAPGRRGAVSPQGPRVPLARVGCVRELGAQVRASGILIRFLVPVGCCGLFVGELLWFAPDKMGISFTYFRMVVTGTLVLMAGATGLAWRRGYFSAWGRFAFFYFAGFLLLTHWHYPKAASFDALLCLGLELPHYFLHEVVIAALFLLVATGTWKVVGRGSLWFMDGLAVVLIALVLVDFRLSQLLHVRLDCDVLALGGSAKMMWRMAAPYLPMVGFTLAGLIAVYWLLVRWIAARIESARNEREVDGPGTPDFAVLYAVMTFLSLGIAGLLLANSDKAVAQPAIELVRTSSLWKRAFERPMASDELLRTANSLGLGYRAGAQPLPTQARRDLNVVLIFQESSYNKYLSLFSGTEETEPLLSRYKDRMEVYPNFFSTFASSIHARFATFTSLYPVKDYNAFTLRRVPVKSIFEVMHENGYHCSLFYSSYLDYTGFRSFLVNRGLDEVYDADTMPGASKSELVAWGLKEEETLRAMRAHIKGHAASGKQFFLTYVPAAPHVPFDKVPKRFQKHQPSSIADLKARYLNELLYMDWVMSSLIDELKDDGLLDRTLVVITDDHGEMLGEEGEAMGHGFLLSPELVNAPLIIMDPAKPGYRVNLRMGSQVDLLPTLLDLVGIPVPPGELYQGRSLVAEAESNRVAWLNAFQHYAILTTNTLVFGDREKTSRTKAAVAYTIKNEGARTIFEQHSEAAELPSIEEFDLFQETLLRNYNIYRKALRQPVVLGRE